ncbi:MAG: ATP-binding protein, partial [Gordonibacter sp.]
MNLGRETEQVEFKKSTSELKEAVVSAASILNKHARGTLYFGVKPNGDVCGQDVAESTLRQISQAIGNLIEPRIHPTVDALNDQEGHDYIRVTFEGDDRPYSCKGAYRIRVADEDVLMAQHEVRKMAADAEDRHNPWDTRPSSCSIRDIDEKTLKSYVNRGNACGRISFDHESIESTLTRIGLMRDSVLTNAAEILFCQPNRPLLKMGIFADHSRIDILDIQQEQGNLFELARKAEFYILSNTRRRVVFDGGLERIEIPEMPMDAVREAIINGFAHRSYRSDLALQIEIYPDSIEIFSPGWFPSGQTPEAHLSGEDKSSNGRNKLIASTLFKSKEIESFGTGLPRIKRLCDAEGISFTYEKNAYGTIVIFHRNDPFAEGMPDSNRGPLHTDGAILPEAALVVYDLIKNSPSISIPEIS